MSDDSRLFGSLPWGRKLETSDRPANHVGSFGPLRRADEMSLRVARRELREIPAKNIEGQGLQLVETTTGETWQVVTSVVDLGAPKTSGVTAFVVRDDFFVPLRPVGWRHEPTESRMVGEVGGYQASGRERQGLPSGSEIR